MTTRDARAIADVPIDIRFSDPSTHRTLTSHVPVARPDSGVPLPPMDAQVLRQVAAQAQNIQPDRAVELVLDPAELGRVRMAMAPSENAATMLIAADRPETLDLMRRHADQLIKELAEQGFVDVHLSFQSGGTGSDDAPSFGDHASDPVAIEPADTPVPDVVAQRPDTSVSASLDLRL